MPKILRFEVLDRVRICIPANKSQQFQKEISRKRAAVVRFKHIVSGAVLALGIMCPALSSYAQEPELTHYQPDYPRLGMIYIGGDQSYPASAWPIMAKFNVVVMGGGRENWDDSRAWTREDVVNGVHAASTVGSKVFQYFDFESVAIQPSLNVYSTFTVTAQQTTGGSIRTARAEPW